VEECVTENDYGGDARNRKRLRWRIVGPWRLANDPLLIAPNDMSSENGWVATVAENALVQR